MIENIAVNRSERMRWRALHIEARAGRYANYWRLANLSLEVGSIKVSATPER